MMDKIINFLFENYRLIADCLAVIVAFIFFLIKKKPVKIVDSIKTAILATLPGYIRDAESVIGPGKGEEKFKYVVSRMILDLRRTQPSVDISLYLDTIEESIENILSTPQKKGEK